MAIPPSFSISSYLPEHISPMQDPIHQLLQQVEKHNLRDMWDMVLRIDYEVSDIYELNEEARDEFFGIITLLVKAFTK